jgi:chaperone BCS1
MTKGSDEVRVWKFTNMYGDWQWMPSIRVASRPVETVVLPDAAMQEVILSLDDFFSKRAAEWYIQHGIPYRRALLFYGVPGAGKTSLARALATHYGRDICFLSPLHPKLVDADLKHAFESAPSRSIVVLEDIDTLFEGRRSLNAKFPITFSGLLNAMDGIGMSEGALTIITTNKHPDHFDPALFRPGRIDLKVYFDYVGVEQMTKMFQQFYPQDGLLSAEFGTQLSQHLRRHELCISCATLQEFFMRMRNRSAADALQLCDSYGWAEHKHNREESGLELYAGTSMGDADAELHDS